MTATAGGSGTARSIVARSDDTEGEAAKREARWRSSLAGDTTLYELTGIDAMLADSGIEWE